MEGAIMAEHNQRKAAAPEHSIPPRSEEAMPGLVDLSDHYLNSLDDDIHSKPGNTLSELPRGIQSFQGTKFDIRGVIQLAGRDSLQITGVFYPEAVKGIRVHHKGRQLHFLHAAAWNPEDGNLEIGQYILHYANGESGNIPIIYQENVSDWWARQNDKPLADAQVAWEGTSPRTQGIGFLLRLFKYTYENPLPEIEIETLDFISKLVHSAPMLVAVTVE
jgi:hypothetical protein